MAAKKRQRKKGKKRQLIRLPGWKRKVFTALDLPEETVPTVQKITLVSKHDMLVENHKGVLKYDINEVRLQTHEGIVLVAGKKLELLQMTESRAYIRGEIAGIRFEE